MKKNIYASMLFTALLAGLSANAGAEDTAVDKPVKYGDKYVCEITTTDQKNYTLDIEWNVEPVKYSKIPKWDGKLVYSLKQDSEQVDSGYYTDSGLGYGKIEFVFEYNKYVFSAHANHPTRVGTHKSDVQIEIAKTYDNDANTVFSVTKFHSSDTRAYYRLWEPTEQTLDIQSSVCTALPKN